MGNEFWTTLIGAIVGAVVGGVISLCIQLYTIRAAAKQRTEESAERRKTLGHALLFKTMRIYSHLRRLDTHLEESFTRAEIQGRQPWQVLLPLANLPERVHFSTDEMAMLLSLGNNDFFNEFVSMDELHNSTIDVFDTYKKQRLALTSQLPAEIEGAVATTVLNQQQMQSLGPKMVELDGLIVQIRKHSNKDQENALVLLKRLNQILRDKCGLTYALHPKRDDEPR